jgi:hypothetical protein
VQILSTRALNRALLDRQSLLRRSAVTPLAMIERLVGLQAQAPFPPYFELWSRLTDFRPDQLSDLIRDRHVVRIALMRSTIHLVSAQDCLLLRPLLQPMLVRSLGSSVHARHLADLDIAELTEAATTALADGPRSPGELGALLAQRWPDRDANALANAVRTHLPLVQVPPRALWGQSGPAKHATAESWLGTSSHPAPVIDDVVRRYLAAYGPASVRDAQTWSGLTRLGEVFQRLRPELLVCKDERGVELFDVPEGPRPDEDTPAPVRLVAPFDNLTLSHADRTRVISDEYRKRLGTNNGHIPGMVLIDGFVAGNWRLDGAALDVDLFDRPSARVRSALAEEGARLGGFAAPGEAVRIRI